MSKFLTYCSEKKVSGYASTIELASVGIYGKTDASCIEYPTSGTNCTYYHVDDSFCKDHNHKKDLSMGLIA